MEATKLRIGNLLRDSASKTLLSVVGLRNDNIDVYVIDRSKFPLEDGWGIEPIPLTPEWLEKFGFERRFIKFCDDSSGMKTLISLNNGLNQYLCVEKHDFYLDEGNHFTSIIEDAKFTGFDYNVTLKAISFVHQLQNLYFTLTDEELTLKD